jgi:hypothetical protein
MLLAQSVLATIKHAKIKQWFQPLRIQGALALRKLWKRLFDLLSHN